MKCRAANAPSPGNICANSPKSSSTSRILRDTQTLSLIQALPKGGLHYAPTINIIFFRSVGK